MEIDIVTDWTSRRLAVAKHSGAVPWHCTSELSSRGEDVAPALLLTCPAGAHFPQTILQHHPQAAVGRCQRLDVSPTSPKARKVAVRRFRQVRAALMSTRVRRPQLPHGCRVEAAGEVVAQGLSSRRSAVGKAGAASPTPGRVRKRTIPCPPGSLSENGQPCTSVPCPTFTSGLSRKSGGAAPAWSPW